MKVSAKLIIAAVLMILSVIIVVTLFSLNYLNTVVSTATVGESAFVRQMTTCNYDRWDFNTLKSEEVFNCHSETMTDYINNNKLEELDTGLEKLSKEHPTFWLPCHDLLHVVGETQAVTFQKGVKNLEKIQRATCQGGLIHGTLDGLALLQPDTNQFKQISTVCANYNKIPDGREAGRMVNYCADGVGHAAWSASKNLEKAVEHCDNMIDVWTSNICAEGILMQMYEPANGVASFTLEEGYKDLPEICATWPSSNEKHSSIQGCYKGSAYVYTRMSRKADLEINNKNPDLSKPLTVEEKEQLYDSLIFAKNLCDKHVNDEGRKLCYEGVSWQIPVMFFLAGDYVDKYCNLLEEHAQTCKTVNSTRWEEQDGLVID